MSAEIAFYSKTRRKAWNRGTVTYNAFVVNLMNLVMIMKAHIIKMRIWL